MEVTSDVLKLAFVVIGVPLLILLCALPAFINEGRELILKYDQMKTLPHVCKCGRKRCPDYVKDLKALEKAIDKSKCKHIRSIFTSVKYDP